MSATSPKINLVTWYLKSFSNTIKPNLPCQRNSSSIMLVNIHLFKIPATRYNFDYHIPREKIFDSPSF
jgi:hypothetical protein